MLSQNHAWHVTPRSCLIAEETRVSLISLHMAPASKRQKTLDAFFDGGKAKKARRESGHTETSNVDDGSDNVYEEPESSEEEAAPAQSSKTDGKIESSNLPPIHDIPVMFSDLVSHVPVLKGIAEHISGRKLRVATMCSGTESPLLALEMICQSIKDQYNVPLEFEHVFSCEIEPFKQAYIERNFKPPLLFRDVCELGNYKAYALISIVWV